MIVAIITVSTRDPVIASPLSESTVMMAAPTTAAIHARRMTRRSTTKNSMMNSALCSELFRTFTHFVNTIDVDASAGTQLPNRGCGAV